MSRSSTPPVLLTLDVLEHVTYASAPWHSLRAVARVAAAEKSDKKYRSAVTDDNRVTNGIHAYVDEYVFRVIDDGTGVVFTFPQDGHTEISSVEEQLKDILTAEAHMVYFNEYNSLHIPDAVMSFVFDGVATGSDSLQERFKIATAVCTYLVMNERTTCYVFSIIHRDERASYRDALARAIKQIEDGADEAVIAKDSLDALRIASDRAHQIFNIEDTAETEQIGDPSMINRIKEAERASRKRASRERVTAVDY
jgi:hypothetical protein